MNELAIYLFGPFEMAREGEPLAGRGARSRQVRTILKVLLLRRGQVVMVDQLLELLWPDADLEKARRSLQVRVSQLRHLLDPDDADAYILRQGEGYIFRADVACWVDVEVFTRQQQQGHAAHARGELTEAITAYEAARNLYRGDLLESDLYEEWTLAARERLREQYLGVLLTLAECYAQTGRYRHAIDLCELALEREPARELAYHHLMRFHYYAGEQAQALRAYERCCRALTEELGVQPLPATRETAAQIRARTLGGVTPSYPPPAYEGHLFAVPYSLGHPPLVGREREYAWLVDRWLAGTPLFLLTGPAGIGKSRLAVEFLGYATGQGATVLQAVAGGGDPLPYAAVSAACQSLPYLRRRLEHAPPAYYPPLAALFAAPDETASPPGDQERLLRAVEWLLAPLPPRPYTLIFIDDAHHLDPASLALLAHLACRITVFLVGRESGLAATLTTLSCQGHDPQRNVALHMAQHTLCPLTQEAVADLIARLAQRDLSTLAAQVAAQTGGIPLYLIATLQHLFEEGILYVDAGGQWATTGAPLSALPPTVQSALEARLTRLHGPARTVFDVVAVTARGGQMELDFALLQEATGLDDTVLLAGVEQLLAAGLLLEPRSRRRRELALAHAAYGEVAYETLPPIRRRPLHAAVAAALLDTEANLSPIASVLATHYEAAGQRTQAGEWWARAGDSAHARYAHEEALAYYTRALPLQEGGAAPLWERIGRLHRRYLGRYAEGARAYEQAIAARRQQGDWPAAVRAYCELAECRREMGLYVEAVAAARAGLALAEKEATRGDLLALAHIRLSNALRSGQLAPLAEIRDHLEVALALARDAAADLHAAEAQFWLGVLAYNEGDLEQALAHIQEALPTFRRSERAEWETMALNNLAYYALQAGRPAQARSWATEGLALAQRAGTVNSEIWMLATLGQVYLYQGNLDQAEVTLRQGLALTRKHGPERLRVGFHHLLALVALAGQDWGTAVELIKEVLPLAEQARPQHMAELHLALARAYLGQGESDRAAIQANIARQIAAAKEQRSREGQAWRLLAQVAAMEGRVAEAERAFARSLALLETAKDRLERARTLAAWGRWQQKLGQ